MHLPEIKRQKKVKQTRYFGDSHQNQTKSVPKYNIICFSIVRNAPRNDLEWIHKLLVYNKVHQKSKTVQKSYYGIQTDFAKGVYRE